MNLLLRRVAVLPLLLMAAAIPAQQNPPREISGSVHDHGGEPLRGAVVQIEAEDTMAIQSYLTNDRGQYHFHNLRPDADYRIWATFRSRHSTHHELSKFDRKADRTLDLEIDLIGK